VSLPCWELFEVQDEAYRAAVLGSAPRIGIEAAGGFGWERWLGTDGVFIGMTDFGASAPYEVLYKHFGITPEAIAATVRRKLGCPSPMRATTHGIRNGQKRNGQKSNGRITDHAGKGRHQRVRPHWPSGTACH